MAELLVSAIDRIGDDIYKNAKLPKRGDVIHVAPDGWNWGVEEQFNPLFLILKVPGVDPSQFSSLLTWEVPAVKGVDPIATNNTLQFRGFNLDLTSAALPAAAKTYAADATRKDASFTVGAGAPALATLSAAKVKKATIADPAVIGTPATVIGP